MSATPRPDGPRQPSSAYEATAPVLELEHLQISSRPRFLAGTAAVGERTILRIEHLAVPHNSFVALVGESGAGKTLLAHAFLGVLPQTRWLISGTMRYRGRVLFEGGQYNPAVLDRLRRTEGAIIFQEPTSYLNPVIRVWRQLGERLRIHRLTESGLAALRHDIPAERREGITRALRPLVGREYVGRAELLGVLDERLRSVAWQPHRDVILRHFKASPADSVHRVDPWLGDRLRAVHLRPSGGTRRDPRDDIAFLRRFPHQFSQGQQQRLMLTTAMDRLELVIGDEPTASLDTTTQKRVVHAIDDLRERGAIRSLLLITHDLRLVKHLCTRPADHVYFLDREERGRGAYVVGHEITAYDCFGETEDALPPLVEEQKRIARSYGTVDDDGHETEPSVYMSVLELQQCYRHGLFGRARLVLEVKELHIHRGRILGIVGESGCGKSTLARAMTRLVDHTDGRVLVQPKNSAVDLVEIQRHGLGPDSPEMKEFRRSIQIIFQDAATTFNPLMTMAESFEETLALLPTREPDPATVRTLFTDLRLGLDRAERRRLLSALPSELSAGQRQRFALARALLMTPDLIIADEPFTNVDRHSIHDMVRVMRDVREQHNTAFVLISHDLSLVLDVCDRIAVMRADPDTGVGRILKIGTPAEIRSSENPYIQELRDSMFAI